MKVQAVRTRTASLSPWLIARCRESSFNNEFAGHAFAFEASTPPRILPGPDRHEVDFSLAFPLHFDLVEMARLDLHPVDLDLAKPDEIREHRRFPGARLVAS